jgi:two-component system chemotaxis response regulator CheB
MDTRNIVVVGASAGGVPALQDLVSRLPADLAAAVFIVLHIPVYGDTRLPEILDRAGPLLVKIPQSGERASAGTIYVAPNDHHLVFERQRIRLTRGPRENRVRPCIDVTFRSAAVEFGPQVVGVVLTGMLDDGTAGLWAIKDQGGIAMVQDPATADAAGMPESAIRHVRIDHVLGVPEIAERIVALTREEIRVNERQVRSYMKLENQIAIEGNALKAGVLKIGELSPNTCPECHGVLVKIREGSISRYRCHTGHAFSLESLLVDVDEAIDVALWGGIRAIEERALVLREMESRSRTAGDDALADQRAELAQDAERRAQSIRDMVVGPARK